MAIVPTKIIILCRVSPVKRDQEIDQQDRVFRINSIIRRLPRAIIIIIQDKCTPVWVNWICDSSWMRTTKNGKETAVLWGWTSWLALPSNRTITLILISKLQCQCRDRPVRWHWIICSRNRRSNNFTRCSLSRGRVNMEPMPHAVRITWRRI